jgi:RHS repeat-associated protein
LETQVERDVLREAGAIDTLRIECTDDVLIVARIQTSPDGTSFDQGRVFHAVGEDDPVTSTAPRRFATDRDLVVMEVSGAPVMVHVSVANIAGDVLAEREYEIPAFAQQIVNLANYRAVAASVALTVQGSGAVVAQTEGDDAGLSNQLQPASTPHSVNPLAGLPASFKAAPFQEPMTGLIMMRDRWYDPKTGTFISPDPEGYRDSPDLYTFAGGDPVNKSDPSGRYQADFHYGMTYFLAKRAGFCDPIARQIAAGAEFPDQDPGRAPVTQGKIMKSWGATPAEKSEAQDMLWQWHFPKPQRNTGDVIPGSLKHKP